MTEPLDAMPGVSCYNGENKDSMLRYVATRSFGHGDRVVKSGERLELTREDAVRYGFQGWITTVDVRFEAIPENCLVTIVTLLYKTTYEEFSRYADTLRTATRAAKCRLQVVIVENTGEPYDDMELNRNAANTFGWSYVRPDRNLGFAGGCNFGLKHADGDIVVFLNDDTAFAKPFLDQLVAPLRTNAQVAVTGARLMRDDGGNWDNYQRPGWVCGACFAVRTYDFRKFGGFDERYFFSWEETDYCTMVTKLGYEVRTVPEAEVIHKGGETATLESEFARTHFERGRAIYDAKWGMEGRTVASMLVGNEWGRYLKKTLAWLEGYPGGARRVETVVIVDDGSTDGTYDHLQVWAATRPWVRLYRNDRSMFMVDEHEAREQLHWKTLRENPTYVLPIDADELLSKRFDEVLPTLKNGDAWNFPIVHLWGDPEHRRVDGLWGLQGNVRFYRVRWNRRQDFYAAPIHCGSAPVYAYEEKIDRDDVALVHFGWMDHDDFLAKRERNKRLDPAGYHEPHDHYENDPITVPFVDDGTAQSWKRV